MSLKSVSLLSLSLLLVSWLHDGLSKHYLVEAFSGHVAGCFETWLEQTVPCSEDAAQYFILPTCSHLALYCFKTACEQKNSYLRWLKIRLLNSILQLNPSSCFHHLRA